MKLSFKRKKSLYQHAFHVYRDWLLFLVFVVFMVDLVVAWHLFLFFKVRSTEQSISLEPSNDLTVDRSELHATIDAYAKRKAEFEKKKGTSTGIVDPSR